jgi:hypothetical protein
MAVKVPIIAEIKALKEATIKVLAKEESRGALLSISPYQLKVQLSKTIFRLEELKENIITMAMGA